jgi:formylglycine-generating enzyme required for sulfatase activity
MPKRLLPLALLASIVMILGCPGQPCGPGKIYDCARNCVDESDATNSASNGTCDEAFNCSAFDFDGGDCDNNETTSTTTAETTTTTGGDIDLTMISIPGGTFEMGCRDNDLFIPGPSGYGCYINELPRHTVIISSGYKMSAYEVTQGQWEAVMGNNPSYWSPDNGYSDYTNRPVESVSWYDVQNFIQKLNVQTGKRYRLPTEAEWEYAVRAGTDTIFQCGDDTECVDDIAVYWGSENAQGTQPVGSKEPNAWGLYDMTGNVWEWCSDFYGFFDFGPITDPQGPSSGEEYVLRGCCYNNPHEYWCRASKRIPREPQEKSSMFGFRLVLEE